MTTTQNDAEDAKRQALSDKLKGKSQRPKGKGTRVTVNGKQYWRVSRTIDGKRRVFYGDTLAEATRKADAKAGEWIPVAADTVGAYLNRWLAEMQPDWKPQTYVKNEGVVRLHINPYIGHMALAKLTTADVRALYATLRLGTATSRPLGDNSRHRVHECLSNALTTAVERGLIQQNPCVGRNVAPKVRDAREGRPLTLVQAQQLLAALADTPLYAAYVLALQQGMRKGEILGLQWQDIDWGAGVLHVRSNAVTTEKGRTVGTPKSKAGIRALKLTPDSLSALRQRHALKGEAASGLVFGNGKPLQPGDLDKPLYRALQSIGLSGGRGDGGYTFHDLRTTFASLAHYFDVPLKEVQAALGHANEKTTIGVYMKSLPGGDNELRDKVAQASATR